MALADPFGVSDERFTVKKCCKCGSWILNPRPALSEMGRFYQSDFLYTPPSGNKASLISRLAGKVQSLLLASETRWVCETLPTGATYLDYSAGNGQILSAVLRRRPDIHPNATDFSETFRHMIEERIPGVTVHAGIDQFPDDARFDVISAFGVLEHVDDPLSLLREFKRRLNPGGVVCLSVPNPGSLQAALFGRHWYSWIAPRHFQLLTRKVFLDFVRQADLSVADEKHFFLRTASSTFALSLFPKLDPLLDRVDGRKLVTYGLLFAVLLPVEWVLSRFKASGFMGFLLTSNVTK